MAKLMDNSTVMLEKPDDLTLEQSKEAFGKMKKGNFDLIMTLANQGLWHICELIFGYLNYETVEKCCKVSELWNESLERIALVKFLEEFGDINVVLTNKNVSTIFPGWQKAVKTYGVQATIEDLKEVKDSLEKLATVYGKCCEYPVHRAAKNGAVKLMEFI